jgi:hypothetical protein
MAYDRPLLTVSLAAGAAFALMLLALLSGTAFMVTGGFGAGAHAQSPAAPAARFARVTRLQTKAPTRQRLAVTAPARNGAALDEGDYAPDPQVWTDALAGAPDEPDDVYAYGDDGRLYRDVERVYAELKSYKAEAENSVNATDEPPAPAGPPSD